jgi:ATP-dependent RNA helicase RhlE
VPQELKSALLVELLKQPGTRSVLAFTRTKHRANRLADYLARHGVKADRIHGNRSQAQRTQALAGFKDGRFQVLVATDIAARGIDIDALSHVVNFDVPGMPDEYIHRVGRTARAEAVGDALTLVSPDEEPELRGIERAVGSRFTRAQLPSFDYTKRPADKLEIPLAERIAQIRTRKAEDRQRARANAERRAAHGARPAHITRGR